MNIIEFDKAVNESRAALENCELGSCVPPAQLNGALAALTVDQKKPEAAVANDVVLSIVAGMSKEKKEIIKDCVLFASLAATKASPTEGVAWYNTFKQVMAYCGWPSQTAGLSDYTASNSKFTMEQEGLKILSSAIATIGTGGAAGAIMLKLAKDTFAVLQASDKPLRLFENSSRKHNGGRFAIASGVESEDGEVIMAMGAVDFSTSLNVTNVLFWEWNSSEVKIKRAENHMILNQRHFQSVSDVIREKLTGNAREALESFDI
ncbi:hypothetical protein [Pseudomonas sp. DWP3-1-2]|uniref:hypothetical protein n=1 Tax=Pseudomonas sp. DWP3-1-2 TaxID=2804645 RepID=UPI003CEFD758